MVGTVKRAPKAERLKLRGKVELRCEFNAHTKISFFWRPYVKNYRLHGAVRRLSAPPQCEAHMPCLRCFAWAEAIDNHRRRVTRAERGLDGARLALADVASHHSN